MKLVLLAATSAMALASTNASASTWVQYDIYGAGDYWELNYTSYPPWWHSHAAFHAVAFIDISSGSQFSRVYSDDPPTFFSASSANGKLNLRYDLIDGDCGHYYCEDWEINLNFGSGAFDTFPAKLPHLVSGDFTFNVGGHWWGGNAYGDVLKVTAKIVTEPGQSGARLAAVPEPASWATLVAGFGLVGSAMRLRRRSSVKFA